MKSLLNIARHPFRYFDLWTDRRALSDAAGFAYVNFCRAISHYGHDHERVDYEKAILDSIKISIEHVDAEMTKIKEGRFT